MIEVLKEINWSDVIAALWSLVLLPLITYVVTQIKNYVKSKQIDKYTDILYRNVVDAVKDVYETIVKDIKGTDRWNEEAQDKVKEIAKTKTIHALTNSAYQILKVANEDFDDYLDNLIGAALYDLKHKH